MDSVAELAGRQGRYRRRVVTPPVPRAAAPRAWASALPLVSVVIPARPGAPTPEALRALRRLSYPSSRIEAFVARGVQPARQRNEAVRRARGEILLFLDDDSEASPGLLLRYVESFRGDPRLGAAGGPAQASRGNRIQSLSALVLGDPRVTGRSAARYCPVGELRAADERELILCNLAVRRSAFEDLGGFDESLYPNEENDFLERMARRGWKLLYDPDAVVERPQRETLAALLAAIRGYGRGRAAQWRRLPSRVSRRRGGLAAAALLGVAAIFAAPFFRSALCFVPGAVYAAYLAGLALRFSRRVRLRDAVAASGLAGLVHASYAAGLLAGVFVAARPRSASAVAVEPVTVRPLGARRAT
ncbi:MAG: glycosyltransferase [Planctomycetota bacterium]